MMPLRVLVVDDEAGGRAAIAQQCARREDVLLIGECSSGAEVMRLLRQLQADVLFLDVQMKPVSGLDVAAAIAERPGAPAIVFVTAFDQYALKAFELNAIDYLLKPFDERRFEAALLRARQRVEFRRAQSASGASAGAQGAESATAALRRTALAVSARTRGSGDPSGEQPLILEVADDVHLVRQSDVELVESSGNYLTFTVRGERHTVRGTLRDIEQELAPPRFLRVQRSVLVGMAHVQSITKWFHGEYLITMTSGRQVTSGRAYRRRLSGLLLRRRRY